MNKLIVITLLVLLISCGRDVKVNGTIVSKTSVYSTSTRLIEYHTIIRTDDGYIEDVTGLSYYALPINTRVKVKVVRYE